MPLLTSPHFTRDSPPMSSPFNLLTEAANSPKLAHELGLATDYASTVLYLAPHKAGGRGNVCADATDACIEGCLGFYSGRADIIKKGETTNAIRDERIRRTQLFFDNVDAFLGLLYKDTAKHIARCAKANKLPAERLNGSSDVPWERVAPEMFETFNNVQFYDYTKLAPSKRPNVPANYHLTHSFSGFNIPDCLEALNIGRNVAVVFRLTPSQEMPQFFRDIDPSHPFADFPIIDGDIHDQRFLDPKNVIVGLRAKGRLRKQRSAFVIEC